MALRRSTVALDGQVQCLLCNCFLSEMMVALCKTVRSDHNGVVMMRQLCATTISDSWVVSDSRQQVCHGVIPASHLYPHLARFQHGGTTTMLSVLMKVCLSKENE
ncbi:hypothetical protein VNO78_23117 [Psophocarpus tetragonolobus]|uniref:Uncharacterized protein n=1 Tax=Psophocarpus tetragonolobus TaxID=3891 RepID=A0AAN9XCY7_PSOTE